MTEGTSRAQRSKISLSQQDRADISIAVLCDCINAFGRGIRAPKEQPESSWTQAMLHYSVPNTLKDWGNALGLSVAEIEDCKHIARDDLTTKSLQGGAPTISAALFARFLSLGVSHPDHEDPSAVTREVVRHASAALSSPGLAEELHSVRAIEQALSQTRVLPRGLGWQTGLTLADVHDVCCRHVLGHLSVSRAHDLLMGWTRNIARLLKSEVAPGDLRREMSESLRMMRDQWIPGMQEQLSALVGDLEALLDHETDCVFPLACDPMCSVLGIESSGSHICLRDGRQISIGNVTEMNASWRPAGEGTRYLDDDEAGHGSSLLGNTRVRGVVDMVHPLGHCRVLLVWRGSPRTVRQAQQQLPRILGSALRTAVMSQNISEGLLELAVSPYFMSADHDMRYANLADDHLCFNIDASPNDFPVASWLGLVVDEFLQASTGELAFAGNASRLLLDADDLIDSSPQQSFVCSMSAVEACLGGKGEAVAGRLARALARLLFPDTQLRPAAERMIKQLYDTRSRVVHGDQIAVSRRQAVFMRFVASCATYNLVGFAKTQMSMGAAFRREHLQQFLGEKDVYSSAAIPGTTTCQLLQALLRDPDTRLRGWVPGYR